MSTAKLVDFRNNLNQMNANADAPKVKRWNVAECLSFLRTFQSVSCRRGRYFAGDYFPLMFFFLLLSLARSVYFTRHLTAAHGNRIQFRRLTGYQQRLMYCHRDCSNRKNMFQFIFMTIISEKKNDLFLAGNSGVSILLSAAYSRTPLIYTLKMFFN